MERSDTSVSLTGLVFILLTAAKKNNLVCGDNKGYASRLLRPA